MVEPPTPGMTDQDLTDFFKDSTCAWSREWLTPQYDRPGSHLEFFLKIQHVHGQKMTDPPGMTDQALT